MRRFFIIGGKIIYLCAILTFILSGTRTVRAEAPLQNPAEVYVEDLRLGSDYFKTGDTVKGSFTIRNGASMPVDNIYYVVLLEGDFKNDLPTSVFDQKKFGPISLNSLEKKTLDFTYTIPVAITGKGLGIRVRAMTQSGLLLGWSDHRIEVSGKAYTQVTVTNMTIVVAGKEFESEEGPTVSADDSISYNMTVSNPGVDPIMLVPHVSIFKRTLTGTKVYDNVSDPVQIGAGKSNTITIDVPHALSPESYQGLVELRDENNVSRAPLSTFRFIQGGDILTIQSLSTTITSVSSGQSVPVTIIYSGTPADITGKQTYTPVGNADVSITLKNELGAVIGSTRQSISFDSSAGEKTLSIPVTGSADSLTAEVVVTKSSPTLAHYSATLWSRGAATAAPRNTFDNKGAIVAMVIGLIGLAVILFMIKRSHRSAPMIVALLGISFAYLMFGVNNASAFTVTESKNVHSIPFINVDWRPTVTTAQTYIKQGSTFVPASTIKAGQEYYIQGTIKIMACNNKPSLVGITIKDPLSGSWGITSTSTRNTVDSKKHITNSYTDDFSFGPYIAPQTPGENKIYIRVFNDPQINYNKKNNSDYGWIEGYQKFNVVAPPPSPDTGAIQVERINADGTTRYDDHTPIYISRFWGNTGGTAIYKRSDVPEPKAFFDGLSVGGGYTTSLDADYPGAPIYEKVLTHGNIRSLFNGLTDKILVMVGIKPDKIFAENKDPEAGSVVGSKCDRPIPSDIHVGICTYKKGTDDSCRPTVYDNLDCRTAPGTENYRDLYYKNGGFNVQKDTVTKVVYCWGECGTNFKYSLSNEGIYDVSTPATVISTIHVVEANDSTAHEAVTLSIKSDIDGMGLKAKWLDHLDNNGNPVCPANQECYIKLQIDVPESNENKYQIDIKGVSSVTSKTETTSFTINILKGKPIISATCRPTVINPITGALVDPASQAALNQPVTWISQVEYIGSKPGNGVFKYVWSGIDDLSGNQDKVIKRYSRLGKKSAYLAVTDTEGNYLEGQIPARCDIEPTIKINPDWKQF